MKHSKWIALLLTGVCAVSLLAGCGSKEKDTSPQTSSQQQGSAKLNEEVYEGSVLSGTVMNYGDGEFSVLAIQEETADDGGNRYTYSMPAPGSEGENNTTKVTYGEDCEFQVVRIDASQKKPLNIKKPAPGMCKSSQRSLSLERNFLPAKYRQTRCLLRTFTTRTKCPAAIKK